MATLRWYVQQLAQDQLDGWPHAGAKALLATASRAYEVGLKFRLFAYRRGFVQSRLLPIPVISVGNLTWGGTGKTPLVEWLARFFLERKLQPLVLTRGYGRDEVWQYQRTLPHAVIGVGKQRYKIARAILERQRIDVAILDDGFQHWALKRDLDLVVVNALDAFGNGRLIPRGILREPFHALQRADVVVISNANGVNIEQLTILQAKLTELAPRAVHVASVHEPLYFYRASSGEQVAPQAVAKQQSIVFSGIGSPQSLVNTLAAVAVSPLEHVAFSDHHQFSRDELERIKRWREAQTSCETITTEKDFFRSPKQLTEILDPLVLKVGMKIIRGEEALRDRLSRLCDR